MLTTNQKKITSLLLVLSVCLVSLNGCGGGGEEKASGAVNTPVPQNDTSANSSDGDNSSETEQLDINELVAEPDFSFTTKSQVSLTVNISVQQQERRHINLYTQYQKLDNGNYYPDPNSRIMRGVMHGGHYDSTFINTTSQQSYLIEVWNDDLSFPLQQELTLVNNNLSFTQ